MIGRSRNENIGEQYRQGDVFLIEAELPADAMLQPREETLILERGEATGHAHTIAETDKLELFVKGSLRFLQLKRPVCLVHEEHDPILLPAKTFEVRRQRTWSFTKQTSLSVAD